MNEKNESHTLDPKKWDSLEQLGIEVFKEMLEYLKTVDSRKVWQEVPEYIKQKFQSSVPIKGESENEVVQQVLEDILPYPPGNISPRFWGWVNGTGTPFSLVIELIVASMNANTGGREHIGNYVERQLIQWMREIFQFPENSSGLVTSGCSVANLIGLTVARNAALDFDVRKKGIQQLDKKLVLYGSSQMHSSIQKAVEILGLGSDAIHEIPCDKYCNIETSILNEQIEKDIKLGFHPFAIVGNVGTVNSGGIDDISELRRISNMYGLWLHLDGAFGALLQISSHKELIHGIEKADSLAFDFHKWMHAPYDAGFILVNNSKLHRETFSLRPSYLASMERGLAGGGYWFSEYGLQLSRGFRALKIWMLIKRFGMEKYGKLIDQNIDQARYFASILKTEADFERLTPVHMNIVCFRYNPGGFDEEKLEEMNKEILYMLYERGNVAPSYTRILGKYCLRIAITNHRSKLSDFDILLEELLICRDLLKK